MTAKTHPNSSPAAPLVVTERGWLDSFDGLRLYREQRVPENPRGALLFVHGFADHCGRYTAMSEGFVAQGFACFHFDYRGHGRSDGRKGHIFSFDEYVQDLRTFRRYVDNLTEGLPRFILAHSNGGLIALHSVADEPEGLTGLVLSSPFFGFSIKVPRLKAMMARQLSKRLPAFAMPTNIPPKDVCHTPEIIAGYGTDTLVGKVATSRWFTETVAAHERCPTLARALQLPVLVQQAGDDKIASRPASEIVFERIASADKTWKLYPGMYHEIWFETERATILADLTAWLNGHLPQ